MEMKSGGGDLYAWVARDELDADQHVMIGYQEPPGTASCLCQHEETEVAFTAHGGET